MKTCKNCIHAFKDTSVVFPTNTLFCKRYPPTIFSWPSGEAGKIIYAVDYVPITEDCPVCGEFNEVLHDSD